MAGIPIENYISIKTKYVRPSSVGANFSALVFTPDAMTAFSGTGTDPYASIRADYAAKKVVTIEKDDVIELFADGSKTRNFAAKFFGYSANITQINLRLTATSEAPKDAFELTVKDFSDFGTFTFLGVSVAASSDYTKIKAAADASADSGFVFVVPVDATHEAAAVGSIGKYPHVFYIKDVVASSGDTTNYGAWMPMSWYADVDYSQRDASDSIDYKSFAGAVATVDTQAGKIASDANYVNYIGRVQRYGLRREFMQKGLMSNGSMDLGIFRDKVWVESGIVRGWFDLNADRCVEATVFGAQKVALMVTDVAAAASDNGIIVLSKPLTSNQVAEIIRYTGNESAPSIVSVNGYFVDAKIVTIHDEANPDRTKYACQYTLVYAKNDHIESVSGLHVIV